MGEPQLNIKDADVTAMVRELTALTGESQTEAVRKALQERLDRTRTEQSPDAERDRTSTLAEIRKIQAEVRRRIKPDDFLSEDDLYDARGLPK